MYTFRRVPDFQLNIWRFSTQILLIMKSRGLSWRLEVNKMVWILGASIFVFIFQICFFRSAALLPLGSHNACFQTTLLVTLALVGSFCFGEQFGNLKPFALVLTLFGIMFVTQPEPLFSHSLINQKIASDSQPAGGGFKNGSLLASTTDGKSLKESASQITTSGYQHSTSVNYVENEGHLKSTATTVGYALVVAAGVVDTCFFLIVKHGCNNIDPMVQCVWLTVAIMFSSVPFVIFFETIIVDYTIREVFFLLGHSITSTLQFMFLMEANQRISSVMFSWMYGMSVVFSFCLQYTALKGIFPGHGNWVEVLGAAMTLAGIVMASIAELIQERNKAAI